MRTKGSSRSAKRSGGGRLFRGFLRPCCRTLPESEQPGTPDLPPLPTYQQHSAGSPAVKGAPRPTPKGLTAGEAVLQLRAGSVGTTTQINNFYRLSDLKL